MVKTASTMLDLGTPAPDFSLPSAGPGKTVRRADFDGKPLLVMFICNHCPFVKHLRSALAEFGEEYQEKAWRSSASAPTTPTRIPTTASTR